MSTSGTPRGPRCDHDSIPSAHATPHIPRRAFLTSAALAGGAAALSLHPFAAAAPVSRAAKLKVGIIGCGGRGTGAGTDSLQASSDCEIWALGDVFPDRVNACRGELAGADAARGTVPSERCFTGFDAYKKVLDSGVDVVILASTPGFRPAHIEAAVNAGKHIFMEKPVAVDPAGVRRVFAAAKIAQEKKLSIVAGTQRRHEICYHEAFKRIHDGAIGKVLHASVYWNQGGLWKKDRQPAWSDVEWQIRNWLYFTWLSGDHIVEQHVHNLDIALWAMGALPTSVSASGGRQVRIDPAYGHVYDHFACEFDYADGRKVYSYCRQIDGCASRVEEVIHGTEGTCRLAQFGTAEIRKPGETTPIWKWKGQQTNPYVQEHKDLYASIAGDGPYLNHAERIAHSTMMAVAGRMAAYTGKVVPWDFAMNSKLDLSPPKLALGDMPVPEVAVPGKTALI